MNAVCTDRHFPRVLRQSICVDMYNSNAHWRPDTLSEPYRPGCELQPHPSHAMTLRSPLPLFARAVSAGVYTESRRGDEKKTGRFILWWRVRLVLGAFAVAGDCARVENMGNGGLPAAV